MSDGRERIFKDRYEAGRLLGARLSGRYAGDEVVILGLPRGGVPVAYEVARALHAPLDVLVVRKLGAPLNPEFAIGAIASGGFMVHDREASEALAVSEVDLERIVAREQAELERRERFYRSGRGPLRLEGKTAILVDDGIATGATMEAGVRAAKGTSARSVVVAAPTGSREAVDRLSRIADEVEVPYMPEPYVAVGLWYAHFPQLADSEVAELLEQGSRHAAGGLGDRGSGDDGRGGDRP